MPINNYERERQMRIAENKARMAQLGLSQTVLEMKEAVVTEKIRVRQDRVSRKAAVTDAAGQANVKRRSERVQGQPAPNYNEDSLTVIDREPGTGGARDRRLIKENRTEEVYSVEHVRALGSHEKEWTLFVDGYDADGNRVYDKVRGQTCHQCRQKTMGKRTACSSCASLQGVFCGDCLFMRYGENIEEVNDNPEWVCPHCRDLCNCSFHRSRRGWAPTGTLYRRAVAQGYASVAHYLVLNNLEDAAKEEALPLMPAELATATRAELKAMAEGQGKEAALLVPSSAEQSASECEGAPAKREQGAEMVAKRTARRDQGSIGVLPRGKVHKAQVAEVGKKRQREAPQSETVIRNRGLHDTA